MQTLWSKDTTQSICRQRNFSTGESKQLRDFCKHAHEWAADSKFELDHFAKAADCSIQIDIPLSIQHSETSKNFTAKLPIYSSLTNMDMTMTSHWARIGKGGHSTPVTLNHKIETLQTTKSSDIFYYWNYKIFGTFLLAKESGSYFIFLWMFYIPPWA